jgi:hypothetical protein
MDSFWFGYLTYITLVNECLDVLSHAFPNEIRFGPLESFVEARMASGGVQVNELQDLALE